jgi:hypothetical protein
LRYAVVMLAGLLAAFAATAQAKGHKGRSGVCSGHTFEKCLAKCEARGGRGKSNIGAQKCSKHCAKRC